MYKSENNQVKYCQLLADIERNKDLDISLRDKYIELRQILDRTCKEITRDEALQFSSLFARIVYIAQKYQIPRSLTKQLHNIRITSSFLLKDENNLVSKRQYEKSESSLIQFLSLFSGDEKIGEGSTVYFSDEEEVVQPNFLNYVRVSVVALDKVNEIIIAETDTLEDSIIRIKYNVPKINQIFNPTIENLWIGAQLNLLNSHIDKDGNYVPSFFVLEPDYLIDASALAECFQNYGKSHLHYFRKRFEQSPNSHYILMGNLANFFLDELIFSDSPDTLKFDTVFLKAFKEKPFEFTSCNDIKRPEDFRNFMVKASIQFENIKRVVIEDFPKNGIDINKCVLEPSFFSEKYGFQGRLDLLQISDVNDNVNKIIELKSGGLPYPKHDSGKISLNHECQTVIYRLTVQSVLNMSSQKLISAILYSSAENRGENLRFAAPFQILDKEIINVRNQIISTEHRLYQGSSDDVYQLFQEIFSLENYGKVPDFFVHQIAELEKMINNISSIERKYFFRFVTFLTSELYTQKIGGDSNGSNISVANLWNSEFIERKNSFDLIDNLTIKEIETNDRDMKILFSKTEKTDFANFREGDICILYPHEKDSDSVLTSQIFKGTIAEISVDSLLLRFRYKQRNKEVFDRHKLWAIEHDRLDHTYNNMYKSLFKFLKASVDKRSTILGVVAPRISDYSSTRDDRNCDPIQQKQDRVIEKAIAAKDYFLIVGPPGTGKTSVFAKRLIEYYYNNTSQNILIIAYTNRAVDELCESINQAFGCQESECDNYIRIGSELSCGENFRQQLLQNIAGNVSRREELRNILNQKRIVIGTLAAITGKPELFDIKKFDLAIIDEASQILEPQIIGILPEVDKYIMIGDHKQLSTITLQHTNKSKVLDKDLNSIKLYNCNESYFERIYNLCVSNDWTYAYDTLTYQGRMHQLLAEYPNKYFYDNILKPISNWQTEPLDFLVKEDYKNVYQKIISENRLHFFDTSKSDFCHVNDKINIVEAEIITSLCLNILELYSEKNKIFDSQRVLGIIAPYRNQIALIKHKLEETKIPELQNIMVDTVERYQGSQKDIIILSFCMNKPYQLDFFSNLNLEGNVDRKLNVAITRARQQLFIVGNSDILNLNPIYQSFVNYISTPQK
ncbi:AAA domain-containing protein [Dysgonomonas sp. 520]|uniref:AAA domain-containing protein n=1 Tax=Dysgonomonas sp. 520 TaxID=2302931 RepID=UPI0013D62951|nr:AAA domain-containing protein [Dysgonomonas sp. 520]NDW09057.1 hypothetical protein [Dysgonomonas sp. 520]